MGKVFNKSLEKEGTKEGLFKRLKNIEDKTETHSILTEDKRRRQWGLKSVIDVFDDDLSKKAKNIFYTLSHQENIIEHKRLNFKRHKT